MSGAKQQIDPLFHTAFLPSVVAFHCALSGSSSHTCSPTSTFFATFSQSTHTFCFVLSFCLLSLSFVFCFAYAFFFSHLSFPNGLSDEYCLSYSALMAWKGDKIVCEQNVFQ